MPMSLVQPSRVAIVLCILLLLPRLFERFKLPGLLGLLAGGFVVGPHGLGLFTGESAVVAFFADTGKLLIMFFAGLEIDLEQFRRARARSLTFGVLTFTLPFVAGCALGHLSGYSANASVLIGSLMASHTLLALPIVERYGLMREEAVTVTVGATVLTDILSLLVLAVCLATHTRGFSLAGLATQIGELALYVPLVLVVVSRGGRWLLARFGGHSGDTYILLLGITVAAIGAELIHLEGIIGAFLAGLAINSIAVDRALGRRLDEIGRLLFVPIFFFTTGFLIEPASIARIFTQRPALVVGLVGGLIVAKLAAAEVTAALFGYGRRAARLMWSLSLPQVAATLASALVAYETKDTLGRPLIDDDMLGSVLVLMAVTSVLGPVLTDAFARPRQPLAVPAAAT